MKNIPLTKNEEFIEASSPPEWLHCADELADAAKLLWQTSTVTKKIGSLSNDSHLLDFTDCDEQQMSATCFLLAGLSIENLLKGLHIARVPSLISNGGLDIKLTHHRLHDLAKTLSDLDISPDEFVFIDHAQRAIPYWGRYPIPTKSDHLGTRVALSASTFQCFWQLYERIGQKLYDEIRGGWNSGKGFSIIEYSNVRYK